MSYGITYMWNPKHYTHELIYKADIESQTEKGNLWSPNGMRGINQEFGIKIYTAIYKADNQQGPTLQQR